MGAIPQFESALAKSRATAAAAATPASAAPPQMSSLGPTDPGFNGPVRPMEAAAQRINAAMPQFEQGMNDLNSPSGIATQLGNILTGGPSAPDAAAGGSGGSGMTGWGLTRAAGALSADAAMMQRVPAAITALERMGLPMPPSAKIALGLALGAGAQIVGELPGLFGETASKTDLDISDPSSWHDFAKVYGQNAKHMAATDLLLNGIFGGGAGAARLGADRMKRLGHGIIDTEAVARARSVAADMATIDPRTMNDAQGRPLQGRELREAQDAQQFTSTMPLPRSATTEGKMSAVWEAFLEPSIAGRPLQRAASARERSSSDYLGNFYQTVAPNMHPGTMASALGTLLTDTDAGMRGSVESLHNLTQQHARSEGINIVDLRPAKVGADERLVKTQEITGSTAMASKLDKALARGRLGGGKAGTNPEVVTHVDTVVMPPLEAQIRARAEKLKIVDPALVDNMVAAARTNELGNFTTVDRMMDTIKRANEDSSAAHIAAARGERNIDYAADKRTAEAYTNILTDHFDPKNAPNSNAAVAWNAFRNLNSAWSSTLSERQTRFAQLMVRSMADTKAPPSTMAEALYGASPAEKKFIMDAVNSAPIDLLSKYAGKQNLDAGQRSNLDAALKMVPATHSTRVYGTAAQTKALQETARNQIAVDYLEHISRKVIAPNAQGISEAPVAGLFRTLADQKFDGVSTVIGKNRATALFNFFDWLQDVNQSATGKGDMGITGGLVNFRVTNPLVNAARTAGAIPANLALAAGAASPIAAAAGAVSHPVVVAIGGLGAIALPYSFSRFLASPQRLGKFMEVVNAIHDPKYNPYMGELARTRGGITRYTPHGLGVGIAQGSNVFGTRSSAQTIPGKVQELQSMDDNGKVDPRLTTAIRRREQHSTPGLPVEKRF